MNKNFLTPDEQATLASYNKHAEKWSHTHSKSGLLAEEMQLFAGFLPSGKIIEIGSGSGRDAKELIQVGYSYTGTDVSTGLIEQAQKNNPGTLFLPQSVYELDFPANTFDGFWASAVLLHIPKNRIDEALHNIIRIVRDGGVGFISLKMGVGEKMIKNTAKSGENYERFFAFYAQEEFIEVLERNKLVILEAGIHPEDDTTWLTFFVRVTK